MRPLHIIVRAGLVVAASLSAIVEPNLGLSTTSQQLPYRNLTSDEVHRNILRNLPSEWLVKSDDLHKYFKDNLGANHTIYLVDEQKFVSMKNAKVKNAPSLVVNGDPGDQDPCYHYTSTWTVQTGQWFGAWVPASQCLWTGLSTAGGSVSIAWSASTSITENANLDWDIIADILSVSIGFSVTHTWSETSTYQCDAPAESVVQIWEQTYLAWGWFWSSGCQRCDFGGGCGGSWGFNPRPDGGATAPASNHFNIGCSTGKSNVQC